MFSLFLNHLYQKELQPCGVAGVPLVMMLVWVVSRVMVAREELGQAHHTKNEMVAMLDVRQFLLILTSY